MGRDLAAAVAAMQARLKTLSAGRVAFADLIDLNVPQGQIIGQLLLLKRLIQHSGVSDMLGVNLNDAQIRTQLQKISQLSADIEVGANTSGAGIAIEALQARAAELAYRLGNLRINATDNSVRATITALQAKVAAFAQKLSSLTMAADTSQLDAQIAAEESRVALLQQKLSGLQADMDSAKAAAKIAALEKQAAGLYKRLDKLKSDVDITAALTKIYAIEAELRILNDPGVKTIVLGARADAINAAIAATTAKLDVLKQKAADIQIGAKADPAQLLAYEATLLGLSGATNKVSAAMAGATVKIAGTGAAAAAAGAAAGGAGRQFGQFGTIVTGGGWNVAIAGFAGWHLLLDLIIEGLIVVTTSMLALGVAALVTYKAFDQLGIAVSSSLNAMTALGVDAGPLAGKLDAIQKAMAPQVFEAYGGALAIVNSQTGILNKLAPKVVDDLSGWIAKLDLWAAGQKNMGGLIQTGIGYLNQLLKIFGTIGQALDNLLTKDPGVARFLLDFIQGVADLINVFSKLPAPIVEATLALHGLYLWSKVLIVAPLLSFAKGLGILSAEQYDAAKSATTLSGAMRALFTTPLGWAVLAAAAIGAFVYELHQASPAAKGFISTIEQGLSGLSASDQISQISADVGELRNQISQVGPHIQDLNEQANKSLTKLGTDWEGAVSDIKKGDLGGFFAKTWAGALNIGVSVARVFDLVRASMSRTADIDAYRGEIVKLSNEQDKLFHVTGTLVTGQNKLGIGALSVSQAFGLMNIAGVQASDSYAVMIQKVTNLVNGYKAMSISSGILNNSVNALTFSTLQQDSKVTELNSAWDTFFNTVSGGESGFTAFATQAQGLYSSLGNVSTTLRDSSGRVSISLSQTGTAATKATASMTGLNAASLNARSTFLQTASAANSQLDSLTLLASASGLGAHGTSLLTQATRDMVAELLPAAKGSSALTSILYALAQRGGYGGANSFKALVAWVGKVTDPMANLDGIVTTLTADAANLTKDIQNLSLALGQTLTQAMSAAILQATGGQKTFDAFATAVLHTKFNSDAQVTSALKLGQQLVDLTGNTKDAHNEFDAFAIQMQLNRTQADLLWSEIVGKLTPALVNEATNTLPTAKKAFQDWANNGLQLSKTKADDLWAELSGKFGPELQNLNSSVPGAEAKFVSWAENGLKLTQTQAESLWQELQTLQGFINGMHGTSIQISMNGTGQYTISGSVIAASQGKGGSGNAAGGLAAGGYVDLGSGPTADDVIAKVSRGEYVVRAAAVAKYGRKTMDKINAGTFAWGGAVPGYAAGGQIAGNLTPSYLSGMQQDFQVTMQNAMVAAMRSTMSAAETAAAAAAASAGASGGAGPGPGGSVESTLKSLAAARGWTGAEWTALNNIEMREAGYSLTAKNPSSGAYGIAQFISGPGEYAQYGGNANTAAGQATAMLNYIAQRYGDPIAAWAHEQAYGWYRAGGMIPPYAAGGLIGGVTGGTPVFGPGGPGIDPRLGGIGFGAGFGGGTGLLPSGGTGIFGPGGPGPDPRLFGPFQQMWAALLALFTATGSVFSLPGAAGQGSAGAGLAGLLNAGAGYAGLGGTAGFGLTRPDLGLPAQAPSSSSSSSSAGSGSSSAGSSGSAAASTATPAAAAKAAPNAAEKAAIAVLQHLMGGYISRNQLGAARQANTLLDRFGTASYDAKITEIGFLDNLLVQYQKAKNAKAVAATLRLLSSYGVHSPNPQLTASGNAPAAAVVKKITSLLKADITKDDMTSAGQANTILTGLGTNAYTAELGQIAHLNSLLARYRKAKDKADVAATETLLKQYGVRVFPANAGTSAAGGSAAGGAPGPAGTIAALRAQLSGGQAAELSAYAALTGAYASGLSNPAVGTFLSTHRTSLTGELATLAKRQASEAAAYAALSGTGLTAADMSKFATQLRDETRTTQDKYLSAGEPSQDAALVSRLAVLISIAGQKIPAAARGALIMDQGGYLQPGWNPPVWNGTGRPERVTPSGGTGGDPLLAELRKHNALLQQLIQVSNAAPSRTGEHIAAAVNGAAGQAAFRQRYPGGGA